MKFLLTGTSVYGPLSADSDIDIVLMQEDGLKLEKYFIKTGTELSPCGLRQDYQGFNVHIPGMPKINIIFCENAMHFECWRYATEQMKQSAVIPDKQDRIRLFITFWDERMKRLKEASGTGN
jgi:hypothetical protein